MTTTYGYGIGPEPEHYVSGFKTGEDALSAALDEADVDGERYVWLYELAPYVYQGGKHAALDLLERIREEAADEGCVDEHCDDAFLDGVKPANVDMLAELIDAWANAHGGRHTIVKRKALYIDGQWMPAGRKLETFGWQMRIDISKAAKRHKAELNQMAERFIATHQPPVTTPISPEGYAA